MELDPEQRTRENLGWIHMKALRQIAKRGRWPDSLTGYDRRRLREAGLVELVYVARVGWQPRLSDAEECVEHNNR